MASPPSGYNLTKKRPSISGPLPPNPSKRRKPSTGPSGLRQTSFPPEESGRAEFSRSPSVDSTYTANTNTTKKKGKKGKGGGDDDVRSTTGTSVRGGKAGAGDGADKADEEEEADQEEGGEALDAVLEGQGEADEKQEKEHLRMLVDRLDPDQSDRYAKYRAVKLKKETVRKITNQTLSQSVPQSVVTTINSYTKVFIGSLIERARTVQQEWQAVAEYAPIDDPRLPANQQPPPQQAPPTPQQQPQAPPPPSPAAAQTPGAYHNPYGYQHLHPSYNPNPYSNIRIPPPPSASTSPAPPSATHAPSSPAVASSGTPSPAPGATPAPTTNNSGAAGNANSAQATTPSASQDTTVPASSGGTNATNNTADSNDDSDTENGKRIPADAPLSERLAERDRGPLTPDHLREALRRYKKDREGGAMGFLGLSLEGRERTAGRMGGKRLFK
ncbi:hypothetical protein SLS58_006155 [Diplodia intermedia]|uniref:TAFII28-like protein domain-containing protein n=1 Tax=Diplodia intermedia TaxID=856260 RepID=A0ABR3TNI7_9PEZI